MLPPGLAARLDLGRLAPVSASFVDEALKWRYSDLLFTAPLDDLADVDGAQLLSRELTPSALVTLVLHLCRLAETPTTRSD